MRAETITRPAAPTQAKVSDSQFLEDYRRSITDANDQLSREAQVLERYKVPPGKIPRRLVDFYIEAPEGAPIADEGFTTWKQLDTLLMAQKHWSDQAL